MHLIEGDDDQHWWDTMADCAAYGSPKQLRQLFIMILRHCAPASPRALYEEFKVAMAADFHHRRRATSGR